MLSAEFKGGSLYGLVAWMKALDDVLLSVKAPGQGRSVEAKHNKVFVQVENTIQVHKCNINQKMHFKKAVISLSTSNESLTDCAFLGQ